jgi:hypothetical protein
MTGNILNHTQKKLKCLYINLLLIPFYIIKIKRKITNKSLKNIFQHFMDLNSFLSINNTKYYEIFKKLINDVPEIQNTLIFDIVIDNYNYVRNYIEISLLSKKILIHPITLFDFYENSVYYNVDIDYYINENEHKILIIRGFYINVTSFLKFFCNKFQS